MYGLECVTYFISRASRLTRRDSYKWFPHRSDRDVIQNAFLNMILSDIDKWRIVEKKFNINRFDETSQKRKLNLQFLNIKPLQVYRNELREEEKKKKIGFAIYRV